MQIKTWDSVAKEVDFNLEIDISEFTRHVHKDATILDFGCGYGRICEILYSIGYDKIIGVDSSQEMIRRGNLEYPHLSLHKNQESTLQYPNSYFGAVVLCSVLTCLPEHKAKTDVLTEIERLLKPGGILHMVEYCDEKNKIFKSNIDVIMHH